MSTLTRESGNTGVALTPAYSLEEVISSLDPYFLLQLLWMYCSLSFHCSCRLKGSMVTIVTLFGILKTNSFFFFLLILLKIMQSFRFSWLYTSENC